MDTFFEFEQIKDTKRVKLEWKKLKGNASLWWDNIQLDGKRRGRNKIRVWSRMITKVIG
jgi:hypothetical protein